VEEVTTPGEVFNAFVRTATGAVRSSDETGARRLGEAADGLRAAMAEMFAQLVRARDPEGYVEAVVDLRGRLREMNISGYAMRLDAGRLSQTCLDAYHAARQAATEEVTARLTELFGIQPGEASFEESIPAGMRSWPEVDEIRRAMR
jgi:hypothetical protein